MVDQSRSHQKTQKTNSQLSTKSDKKVRDKRRAIRQLNALLVLFIALFVSGLSIAAYPFILDIISQREQIAIVQERQKNVSSWPYPEAQDAIKAAQEYNKQLYESGQPIIGQVDDPFLTASNRSSSQKSKDDSITTSKAYKHYLSLLNEGGGIEGSVVIPEIGVNLPIYHGTSEATLASGAGQIYGTSLPVGGINTRAVIAAHTGFIKALMFTRLTEMKIGDDFYIKTMGETLAYKVISIKVILPTDASAITIVPGKDLVTLLTCTPYGINTHRLLVTGERVKMPQEAPYPSAVTDPLLNGICCGFGGLLFFILLLPLVWRKNHWKQMQHAKMRYGY